MPLPPSMKCKVASAYKVPQGTFFCESSFARRPFVVRSTFVHPSLTVYLVHRTSKRRPAENTENYLDSGIAKLGPDVTSSSAYAEVMFVHA